MDQNKYFARMIMFTVEFSKEYNEKIKELKQLELKGYNETILDKIKELEPNNLQKAINDDDNDDDDDSDSDLWL